MIDVIFLSLIGGVMSLVGGLLLIRSRTGAEKLSSIATPFAAGALLAAVFVELLPKGLHEASEQQVLMLVLIGILLFFLAEKFLGWFHHHHEHHNSALRRTSTLVVIGDTIHNALDGVTIAAAYMISPAVGLTTTLAVALHEIPQEIGDFGILLKAGVSRRKVLTWNIFSSLATVVAAVITYQIGTNATIPIGALLGLSAGFLLYIAMSDLIPTIHADSHHRAIFDRDTWLLLLGVISIIALTGLIETWLPHP